MAPGALRPSRQRNDYVAVSVAERLGLRLQAIALLAAKAGMTQVSSASLWKSLAWQRNHRCVNGLGCFRRI